VLCCEGEGDFLDVLGCDYGKEEIFGYERYPTLVRV